MQLMKCMRWGVRGFVVVAAAALLVMPASGATARVVGKASAVRATRIRVSGTATTLLAYTGPLGDTADSRQADLVTGSVPSTLTGEVLNAVTVGFPDEVDSEASAANIVMNVGGSTITADFLMASASSSLNGPRGGYAIIDNLSVDGVPVQATGQINQIVRIPGGRLVINEQSVSSGTTTVNALHALVPGVDDVVVASASAGIR